MIITGTSVLETRMKKDLNICDLSSTKAGVNLYERKRKMLQVILKLNQIFIDIWLQNCVRNCSVSMPVWIHSDTCVNLCACFHACVSQSPLKRAAALHATHIITPETERLPSKPKLIQPSKFKAGRLPNIPTTIRFLQPLLSLSFCHAFCIEQNSGHDSCLVPQPEEIRTSNVAS